MSSSSLLPKASKDVLMCINNAIEQQSDLNKNWSNYASFIYAKTLSQSDIQMLNTNNRDTFDFNIVRPFIWKSLKNVKDSSMTSNFEAEKIDDTQEEQTLPLPQIVQILNQKYQKIQDRSCYNDMVYQCSMDAYVGGKGVFKVKTEYENDYNFSQNFKMERVLNPTRIYFDNKARKVTKADGEYVFEIISIGEDQFKRDYPHINVKALATKNYGNSSVVYEDGKSAKKMIDVIEYYYRKPSERVIYRLKNGKTVTEKPKNSKSVLKTRKIDDDTIMMQRIVGDLQLSEPVSTNFKSLPFIMVMGERFYDKNDKEHIFPYAKHAFDAQRVKNIMMNFFLYEAVNNRTATTLLPVECATEETEMAIRNPAVKNIIRYKALHMVEGGSNAILEPTIVPSTPLPDQYLQAFSALDATIEATLGANMPSLSDTNLSGKALYNLSQFISASNEQFMQHLEEAVVQLGRVILEAMPALLEEEIFEIEDENAQKMEKSFDFRFQTALFNVKIVRGVSNKLQQEATIETLMDFAEKSPMFAQFMNTPEAITLVLNNLDLNNKDKLMSAWDMFMQQQQQQSAQPNPQEQTAQTAAEAKMISAKAAQASIALKEQELGLSQRNKENDQLIEQHKIKSQNDRSSQDNQVKIMQSKDNLTKHLIDHAGKQHATSINQKQESY